MAHLSLSFNPPEHFCCWFVCKVTEAPKTAQQSKYQPQLEIGSQCFCLFVFHNFVCPNTSVPSKAQLLLSLMKEMKKIINVKRLQPLFV